MTPKKFDVAHANSDRRWTFEEPVALVWTDPPYGTNKVQSQGESSFRDVHPNNVPELVVSAVTNVLMGGATADLVVCVCLDYRAIHQTVVRMGAAGFYHQGDVIWTFGLGRPRTSWWPVRHNTIATFTLSPNVPDFDADAIPRVPRRAKSPGYPEDKPAGSVWDITMSNSDPQRVGYPNQKPLSLVTPFILAHTKPGDVVADPFCGSGTTGHAALVNGRRFIGQDNSMDAIDTTQKRLEAL